MAGSIAGEQTLQKDKRKTKSAKAFPEEDPEFQIAPMIDILLVLLVFFMSISSTEVLQVSKEIQLPVAKDARESKDNPGQAIINVSWISMSALGKITVDERVYPTADALIPMLQDRVAKNPMTRVLIRADREVRYEYLRTVLKAVGDA